jgi:hypothetical protein
MCSTPGPSVLLSALSALLFTSTMVVAICPGQTPGNFDGCPLEGKTTRPGLMALNRLKNRAAPPLKTNVNPSITLDSILAPGNDLDRWNPSQGAVITGYVVKVKAGGPETVNCGATDAAHTDTHIEIALEAGDRQGTHRMIVEVTPRIRTILAAKGKDWSTKNLQSSLVGHKILVMGWMMLDKEHCNASENTNPGGVHNWRATCWEIHPVFALGPAP